MDHQAGCLIFIDISRDSIPSNFYAHMYPCVGFGWGSNMTFKLARKLCPQFSPGEYRQRNKLDHSVLRHRVGCMEVTSSVSGKNLLDNTANILKNDFTVVVYNFIDMLSHARTEMEVLKELASDEKAYRSLTRSWFLHSPLYQFLQMSRCRI